MHFITTEDFKIVVGETALKVITQASDENRENAINEAMEEISGYLRPKYDCNAVFLKEGKERNRQMVMLACDIALYHMISAQPQKMGAEIREERYKRAIVWLEGVQAGKIIPDIPLTVNDDGEPVNLEIRFGSQKQQRNNW